MPDVRTDEDCRRLIAALEKPVYRGCFTVIYAYGLRISEAATLPLTAVDSKRMVLRVIGKRNKERILPLTESILDTLRKIWKTHRSKKWLFPSRRIVTHLPDTTARNAFNKARDECGFEDSFRPHSLRHYAEFRIMPSNERPSEKAGHLTSHSAYRSVVVCDLFVALSIHCNRLRVRFRWGNVCGILTYRPILSTEITIA